MKRCVLAGPYAGVEAIYMDLARQLDLPDHFGANLDALWDALTRNVPGPVEIVWPEFSRHSRRLGVAADRTLHVGDTPAADVVGARAAGLHPVLVDPYDHHADDRATVRVRHLADVADLIP